MMSGESNSGRGEGLTSTTAPGKAFASRSELADHYKSDWHKYNLKRREAGLPLLQEVDFRARLEAALALRKEREGRDERNGTDHLKNKTDNKKKQRKSKKQRDVGQGGIVTTKSSQAAAYDRLRQEESVSPQEQEEKDTTMEATGEDATMETTDAVEEPRVQKQEEETPVIEPRQCLFDKHISRTVDANLERMQLKYGFFVPDQEYLIDKEGLLGYCQEKIKLGHYCLYCQRIFTTWHGCQKHMIASRHTKLRYERGIDMEEFDPFYDFSQADAEFLGTARVRNVEGGSDMEVVDDDAAVANDDGDDWEDVTDDEDMEAIEEDTVENDGDDEEDDGLYAGYQDEIAKYGFDVTPLGELVFPDGRIIGHRGLARYYKQRLAPHRERAAVAAARRAAGERLYHGRVYQLGNTSSTTTSQRGRVGESSSSALALARAGVSPGTATGRASQGILVPSGSGGFTALSLYRYRAVVKKARREDSRGQRLQNKTKQNINRMDKKHNRLNNGVSVAHAPR